MTSPCLTPLFFCLEVTLTSCQRRKDGCCLRATATTAGPDTTYVKSARQPFLPLHQAGPFHLSSRSSLLVKEPNRNQSPFQYTASLIQTRLGCLSLPPHFRHSIHSLTKSAYHASSYERKEDLSILRPTFHTTTTTQCCQCTVSPSLFHAFAVNLL